MTALTVPAEPVTIPPYLLGETVQFLAMTPRGTRLVDATITAVTPEAGRWRVAAELGEERSTFALAPTEAQPLEWPCPQCGVPAGQGCRLGCTHNHLTPVLLTGHDLDHIRRVLRDERVRAINSADALADFATDLIGRLDAAERGVPEPPRRH